MNTIFGYCGWDFGSLEHNKYNVGEPIRIGRDIFRVIFRIGTWHLLKKI